MAPRDVELERKISLTTCGPRKMTDGMIKITERAKLSTMYGPFLFLPTCHRCCYICLWRNRSLWVIALSVAKKCFGLSTARIKKLPTMRSLPGRYHVNYGIISRQRPMWLVCVGSAKRLALDVNGSEERMKQDIDARFSAGALSWSQYDRFCSLQKALLSPLGPTSVFEAKGRLFTADTYPGMASVSFPYLAPDKRVEHGSWCLGCKRASRQWKENGMRSAIPKHLSHLLVAGRWEDDIMYATEDIAWAEKDFISHIDECPGVKEIIACGTPENFDYQDWCYHTFYSGGLEDADFE